MSNPFEIFKVFPDHPNYDIGDEGSVRYADRREVKVFWTGGRAACKINVGGRQRTMSVARAMLRAFVGEPERASHVAMPKDGDPTNLLLSNWEWRPRVGLAKPSPTAKELRRLPQPERNEVLRQAAEQAVAEGYEQVIDPAPAPNPDWTVESDIRRLRELDARMRQEATAREYEHIEAAVTQAVEKVLGEVVSRQQYDAVVKVYAAEVDSLQSQRERLVKEYEAKLATMRELATDSTRRAKELRDQLWDRDHEIGRLGIALANLRRPWWKRRGKAVTS